jgi:hypothetical protein
MNLVCYIRILFSYTFFTTVLLVKGLLSQIQIPNMLVTPQIELGNPTLSSLCAGKVYEGAELRGGEW